MTFVPLILVVFTLAIFGYMTYMANLVVTICQHAERQDKKWNK
jgi:uncharacterized integral membrane protein